MIAIITDSLERAIEDWVSKNAQEFHLVTYLGKTHDEKKFKIFRCVGSLHAESLRGYQFESVVVIGKPNKKSVETAKSLIISEGNEN